MAGQEQAPPESIAAAPQLVEIARSAKSLYITGREGWVGIPTEPVEKQLFEYPEFKTGQLILLRVPAGADILVELDRKPGTWDFTYQMTHRKSGILLGTGKVIAWDGVRAGSGLAKQIIKRLRELRGTPPAEKKK
jgi:hypothetical protein